MTTTNKPPKWFYIVAILGLIWNLLGDMAYISQVIGVTEGMTEEQIALVENTPSWANAAFAIAVWGGSFGCLLLLLRKSFAYSVFIISLIGIIVQMSYNLFISNAIEVYGPGGLVMPIMVLALGLYLIFVAKKGKAEGWLS